MKIMTVYEDKNKCCGCSACAMVCPKHCIEMKADEEGFLYPEISIDLCIDCSKCRTVCPVLKTEFSENEPDCYVAFSRNKNIRQKSSSGGVFTELARKQIEKGSLVYGAGFNEKFEVIQKAANSMKELENLRGSKYVQSRMGDSYLEVEKALESEKSVYFSGTPCQVSGLYSYLGKRPEQLVTQDFICHGVPSPLVWKKYLDTFGNVWKAEFRNKKYGWHYFALHIDCEKKKYYKRLDEDFYLKLFLDNTILRPICYDCPIKSRGSSSADITLADCWSLKHMTEKVEDTDQGLSLVIANTLEGKRCVEKIKNSGDIFALRVDTERALSSQSTLRKSASCNPRREEFFERLRREPFSDIMENWFFESFKEKCHKKYIYLKTKIRFALRIK